jgi:hypothetical protein
VDGETNGELPGPAAWFALGESRERGRACVPLAEALLAVSAALLLTAFFAVSELATLRGAKAHDASAYLTRELGSPLSSAPLVRQPTRGTKVTLRERGFHVSRGHQSLTLDLEGADTSSLASFAHGVSARTSFGRIATSVSREEDRAVSRGRPPPGDEDLALATRRGRARPPRR